MMKDDSSRTYSETFANDCYWPFFFPHILYTIFIQMGNLMKMKGYQALIFSFL